jgi:hypothetical protein
VLLPLFTGLLFWKYQGANARIMIILLVFASFSQFGGTYIHGNKNSIYNLYTITDASLWSLLFYRNTHKKTARILILVFFSSLIAYAAYCFLSSGISERFYSELVCFDSSIQVFCVLIYFYEKYYSEKILKLKEEPLFWFCLAILFYAPGTYFLFVYWTVHGSPLAELWGYHGVLNTMLYLIITIGLLIRVKKFKPFLQWI